MPSFKYTDHQAKKYNVAQLEKDEDGKGYITERYLKELCEENG
jgi:hypothetical protein